MVKKAKKMKVLVRIHMLDHEGDEAECIRQFTVTKKILSQYNLAFQIGECLEKKFDVDDMEAWSAQ
jgi:hypothetical protein